MPTTAQMQWSGQKLEPYLAGAPVVEMDVKFVANLGLLAKGTVLGRVTATGLWKPYNDANADGSEVARAILAYDINVDANGKVTYTTTAGQVGGEWGQTSEGAPAYFMVVVRTNDLTGLDAAAVTDLGRLWMGTVADGILSVN